MEWGGLGFRELECFNRALLAKQGWRLSTIPNSILAISLKARYYPRNSFLQATLGYRPSYTWCGLIDSRPILKEGLCWTVRNGRCIRIFEDP